MNLCDYDGDEPTVKIEKQRSLGDTIAFLIAFAFGFAVTVKYWNLW